MSRPPSFAAYMERCLHDPETGYYGAGKVAFGLDAHYWTYPQRMRPVFGWMVAELARELLTLLDTDDHDEPLTLLELGAGEGQLGADILAHVERQRGQPRWAKLGDRLRYVSGELSPALRTRQRERLGPHLASERALVETIDARQLAWESGFRGLVFANELLDALPVERLRIHGPGSMSRIHVAGQPGALREVEYPLGAELGAALDDYLATLAALIAELDAAGRLPVELHWPPGLPSFVEGLAGLLDGPGCRGLALLIDYGGTSRHVLDPASRAPHFRVYGSDPSEPTSTVPTTPPGTMT